jgi:hypothetical protein
MKPTIRKELQPAFVLAAFVFLLLIVGGAASLGRVLPAGIIGS